MLTLSLYGPRGIESPGGVDFVLPAGMDEREIWTCKLPILPPLTAEGREAFVADYRRIMDRLDRDNAHSDAYWYSALGSRNTQNSLFYNALEQFWRLDQLLRLGGGKGITGKGITGKGITGKGTTVGLLLPNAGLVEPVRRLAEKHGARARLQGGLARRSLREAIRKPLQALRYVLTLCDYGRGRGDYGPEACDVIVATVSGRSLLETGRRDRDFIFGDLPADLHDSGLTVMTFAHLLGPAQPAADLARRLPPPAFRTLADIAGPRDAVAAVARSLSWRPRIGGNESGLGIDISPLIREDAAICRWRDLPSAFMMRAAFRRLLRRSPRAVLVHPFENNGWEHACRSAASAANRETVALQHNALLRSYEKLYATQRRPRPDRIVAAGPESKAALHDVFGYVKSDVGVGYSIRQSSIYRYRAKTSSPGQIRQVLVLLQGTPESLDLLNLVAESFQPEDGHTVSLRGHPSIVLEDQLPLTKLAGLPPPFRKSDNPDLHDEILKNDVTLFIGSTAGFESIALGVPAIYVDLGNAGSANPLASEPSLNRSARTPKEIRAALQELSALTEAEFQAQASRARRFFEESFARRTDEGFKQMLAALNCTPGGRHG